MNKEDRNERGGLPPSLVLGGGSSRQSPRLLSRPLLSVFAFSEARRIFIGFWSPVSAMGQQGITALETSLRITIFTYLGELICLTPNRIWNLGIMEPVQ